MSQLRFGIIGLGNMGSSHAKKMFQGETPRIQLTAVCDIRQDRLDTTKGLLGDTAAYFLDAKSLYESGLVDAVIIATPHYSHPALAIDAFAHGLHVLVEKPAGVYTKQVLEMNAAAEKSGKVFGIMYNQRTNPLYQKARDLIQNGELGKLNRFIWIITSWYRSQAYHDSSEWRSTWKDEGGGVLINQCPHNLDLWQWMIGMPQRIRSFCYFGKHYNIEVEDDVTAFAEYKDGATAVFITTTSEVPGTNRLEITGDNGKIVIEHDKLTFYRTREPIGAFNSKNETPFASPEVWECSVPANGKNDQHVGIFNNFADAVLDGKPLLAPGLEGINGLTISNAIHLSTWTDGWVDVEHFDHDQYAKQLQDRIDSSTYQKPQVKEVMTTDMSKTH